ncbi:DNA primase large subunit [Lucilia cuprina]|uniref:DNA primase large subunit n=1 Tax=Lucilia cuprina TaxID=7375 RepID=A0A0L0CC58_LUCCU|nr:DNA primase large subunit [Lucilia cuprina]KNC29835.1 DNA primase large subunit [Lucilia cuprina]
MDFRRKTKPRIEYKPEYENLEQKYPHNVLLYRLPPIEDIQIHEFEELSLERLKVLRILEQAHTKGLRLLSDDWKEYVHAELSREGLKGYLRLCTNGGATATNNASKHEFELQARRRDYISHFILRLVYCRTMELKRWFLAREMELFKYKFSTMTPAEIKHFLELHKLNYTPLSKEQKNAVKDGLFESTMGQSVAKIEMLDFYKVPFTQVLDLVRSRRCYLKDGQAYVNTNDFISIVAVKQMDEIEHGLQAAQRSIRDVETDERLFHLLKSLHTSYTGKDYTVSKNANVPIESLDQLSKKSFPLCMRVCHEHIRATHHIKHDGRMQYGLFLKGIGVTLEDSIRFWREEFCRKMDPEKFSKSYQYNIEHNYGKKGSMVNYTPYSCLKIIQENAVPGSVHGCPYKIYDQTTLKNKMAAAGLSSGHVQEVMSFVAKGHYQLACGKFFQITHESSEDVAITHPNQYFEQSQIVQGNRTVEKKPGNLQRKTIKSSQSMNETTMFMNNDDDDELWNLIEMPKDTASSTQQSATTNTQIDWDDDLDLTAIEC